MIFKDRKDAAQQLSEKLLADPYIQKNKTNAVVVSLLRGGTVLGHTIAQKLGTPHLALSSVKIPSPHYPELGLGALCFDFTYLDPGIIGSLGLPHASVQKQITIAQYKFKKYQSLFRLKKKQCKNKLYKKIALLVDDGIATGSTAKAAYLFLRSLKPNIIVLAVPVAPTHFHARGFDRFFVLYREDAFSSVSQFYAHFPQVDTDEVVRILFPGR